MKKYCVYCHTNKINGKRYVGITCEKPEKRKKISDSHSFHKKKIGQYSPDGDLIQIFESLHDLERTTGYFRSAITNYLKGKSNYCYGFIWKYE